MIGDKWKEILKGKVKRSDECDLLLRYEMILIIVRLCTLCFYCFYFLWRLFEALCKNRADIFTEHKFVYQQVTQRKEGMHIVIFINKRLEIRK